MPAIDIEVIFVKKLNGNSKLKALVDAKVGGLLAIKGFSVTEGPKGLFVSMPRQIAKDGRWYDTMTPLDKSLKEEIQNKILEAYDKACDKVAV